MTHMTNTNLSRRGFIGSVAGVGAIAAMGLAGCAPQPASEPMAETGAEAAGKTPAGSDWLGSAPEIAESEITGTDSTDLLIVGAGMSGLMAALHAAERGMDFILCESTPTYASAHFDIAAFNSRFQKEAGVEVDAGRWLNEWARYASFKNDMAVGRVWLDNSGEFVEWLADTYAKYAGQETVVEVSDENGSDGRAGGTMYYIPNICHAISNPGFGEGENGRPKGHTECITMILEELGHPTRYEHELVKLIREENGPVTGAIFKTQDGYTQIDAKNIVLATGGYAANPEMMKALNPRAVMATTSMNANPANLGGGIKAAMWVGAAKDVDPAAMLFDRGIVPPGVDAGYDDTDNFATSGQHNLGSQPFLKVNRRGKRFANESANYDSICHAAANHPGGVWCLLMDSNAADDVNRFQSQGCSAMTWKMVLKPGTNPSEAYAKQIEEGLMFEADTLEELGAKLGFEGESLDNFLATCERYNELYDLGEDADFGKEAYRLSELRNPPFYGAWYGASILTTLDGLCINEHLQVLDTEDEPIEGLYAIGTCSGRYYAGNYPVYLVGNCLGRNTTFGYQVIKEIDA